MVSNEGFLVEEFINAITSQLDRVQDALRLKAVNRPLTYALKDFFMELQVFVEVDSEATVRFRTSNPNETGASTIRIGFTTITKPMIEENTISLAVTRSPSLEELGLDPAERQRLEQFGVRNAAQLQKLGSSTGATAVSRLAGIPVDRLRQALQLGHPTISNVKLEPVPHSLPPHPPVVLHPVVSPPRVIRPQTPLKHLPIERKTDANNEFSMPSRDNGGAAPLAVETDAPSSLPSGFHRLSLQGSHLVGENGPPVVLLNQQPLEVIQADDHEITIEIKPHEAHSGPLEVELSDGKVLNYVLSFEPEQHDTITPNQLANENTTDTETGHANDPWLASEGEGI